ncbi:hypothetical protein ACH4VR_40305 [Streptomyces sp. NPDC020883]|uniref:hypothetical protein n=1 Tax=Streptomyces sp. NPDC020883 TaxID=3365099 RepID=UPI003797F4A8
MSPFRLWKRYAHEVEAEVSRAGFDSASYAVLYDDPAQESSTAIWDWRPGAPRLNRQEWPLGLTLTWSSRNGRWTCAAVDRRGRRRKIPLPVPALAAPLAISAALPALMDGRLGQLPSSTARWEHADVAEAMAASSYGSDKYDEAYQAAQEQAADFRQWQQEVESVNFEEWSQQLEGSGPDDHAGNDDEGGSQTQGRP